MRIRLQVRFQDALRRLTKCAFPAALLFVPGIGLCQSEIPSWVPIYPEAKVEDISSNPSGAESYLWFRVSTRVACGRVWRFYDEKLKLAGFSVITGPIGDDCPNTIRAHGPRGQVNLSGGLRISYDSRGNPVRNTDYGFEVVQPNASSMPRGGPPQDGGGRIPAWVPAYPGAVPLDISARRDGRENFITFRFNSRDDTRSILSWYEQRLKQMGFNVSTDVIDTRGLLRSNTRDQSRAVKIDVSAAGGQNLVAFEIRDGR